MSNHENNLTNQKCDEKIPKKIHSVLLTRHGDFSKLVLVHQSNSV